MRVCFISNQYPPFFRGGDATVVYNEATYFARKGHKVHVIFNPGTYKGKIPKRQFKDKGVTIHPLNLFGKINSGLAVLFDSNPKAYSKIKTILEKIKPDVVHCHNVSSMGLSPIIAAQSLGLPVFYTSHDPWLVCALPQKDTKKNECRPGFLKCLFCQIAAGRIPALRIHQRRRSIIKKIDKIIVPSQFMLKNYKAKGFGNVVVVPNGIKKRKGKIKGLKRKLPTLLFVGHLEKRKGPIRCIKAVESMENVRLFIVGSGKQKKEIEVYTKKKGLGKKVNFLDMVADETLSGLYEICDIFLLPSTWENNPMTIIEAMAHKCAVVSSAAGGSREMIKNMKNGILIKNPYNINELIRAIEKIISNRSLLKKFKENNVKEFKKKYTIEKHCNKLLKIYKEHTSL